MRTHKYTIKSDFDLVKSEHDTIKEFEPGKGSDDIDQNSPTRDLIRNTFSVTFGIAGPERISDRVLVMDIYEDGTFRIGSSACVNSLAGMQAYGRAAAFLAAAGLKDYRSRGQ